MYKFKINDKVKVIDYLEGYPCYDYFFKMNNIDSKNFVYGKSIPDKKNRKYIVVGRGLNVISRQQMYVITSKKEKYLINEKGLKLA